MKRRCNLTDSSFSGESIFSIVLRMICDEMVFSKRETILVAEKLFFTRLSVSKIIAFVFVLIGLASTNRSEAQLSSLYTYSYLGTNANAYNATPTILQASGAVGNDAVFTSQAIGFSFQFACNNYTTCGISANGFIWFGTGTCATTQYTPLSSTTGETGAVDGIISAFGANLVPHASGTRTLSTKLTGVSPNQVFTIEWRKACMSGATSNPVDIQIKLFQTTNKVEIRLYDSPYFISGANAVGQVGMRTTTSNFVNRNTTGFNLCTTIAGVANTNTCSIVPTTSCNYATSATGQAITFNYAFTGSCCTPPNTQASIGSFSGLTTSAVAVNWTNGNGAARVVVAHQTSAVSANPANGTDYTATANAVFGSGANLGSNNYVVYQGTGTSVNVTGLTGGQTYFFSVFEYATSPSICYLTPGSSGSQLIPTCFPPTTSSSGMSFSNVLSTSNDVNWVRGNGDAGVVVVARLTSTASVAPVSGTTYATTTFGSGSGNQLTGAGNYVVYVGTGTTVNVSNLLPTTSYTYSVYEYMIAGTCYGSASTAAQTTASCSPSTNATAAVFSNVLGTSLTLSFTRGSGSDVMVIARATATTNVAPVYNTSYAANPNFGSGATTGTGNYVVYNGTGNTVNVTGLAQFTAYTFLVYEYNATPNCYSISPLTSAITTLNTTASGLVLSCAYTVTNQSIALSTITGDVNKVTVATGAAIDDGNYPNQNIATMTNGSGFLFSYLGTDYSSIGVNANGFIWFGSGQPGATYASYGGTPVGTANANLGGSGTINGIISAAGADLISHYHLSLAPTPSQIAMVVTGVAPNRVATIEWNGFQAKVIGNNSFCWQIIGPDDSRLDFQIKLYEKGGASSNRVEIILRDQAPVCVFDPYNFQVGMRGSTNADFATRANVNMLTTSSSTNGGSASTTLAMTSSFFIQGNVAFRYAPSVSTPTVTGALSNVCPSVSTTLTSSSASNNQWFLNGSVVPGPGSNTQNLIATQSGLYTVTVNGSGCYAQSAASTVTISPCAVNITASAGTGGSISPTGVVAVPYGTNQAFTITPSCGYQISNVLVDGNSLGPVASYTFINVIVVHSISVSFVAIVEICNGLDDDCDGFTDEGFDLDTDGYTTCAGDCNDADMNVNPGAPELCTNAIDDDCDVLINEGCIPVFNGDTPGTAPIVTYSSNAAYPNCYPITGDLTSAGDSPESFLFTGPDAWYAFTAQSNGVCITLSSAIMDNAIGLYTKSGAIYTLIDNENVNPAGVGGYERLTNNSLVSGTTYYISVGAASGIIGGSYSLCIQHLMPSGCAYTIPIGGFSLCSNYKALYRGAATNGVTYNFNFNGVGGGASGLVTLTGTNGLIPLSNVALGIRYGGIYDVTVDVVYSLQNGSGAFDVITIYGNVLSANCSGVVMMDQPDIEVKLLQRCPAVLLRSNYLIGTPVVGDPNVCSSLSYTYKFTKVVSCANGSTSALPVEYNTTGSTPYLQLGNLPTLPNVGSWDVNIRPNFLYGNGTYGPTQRIVVNGTSAAAMLPDEDFENDPAKKLYEEMAAALYPNPNNGEYVNLNLTDIVSDHLYVRIMDEMGRTIFDKRYIVDGSLNTVLTFPKVFCSGVYMVEFLVDDKIVTERMIVN